MADDRFMQWTYAGKFTWANEGRIVGLIPTRYPGSETADDVATRLARKTDWVDVDENLQLGLGQRILATDENDYSLLDVRQVTLDSSPPDGSGDG